MRDMIKIRHHGVLNREEIISSFKSKGFSISNYEEINDIAIVSVDKDYSASYNISFDGFIKLKALVHLNMYKVFFFRTYPVFYEVSNLIPKEAFYHVYKNGSLCYAPPQRPLDENWRFIDFVNAVDSLIHNYFSIEYIGNGVLTELEHGYIGLEQYNYIKNSSTNKN